MKSLVPLRKRLLETASDLMAIRSTADRPDELRRVIEYVHDFFDGVPVWIERTEADGKPAIVICTRMTRQPAILMQGHLDVVDGADAQFEPRVEGNRLYGRGAVDMKAFVAVAMHILADVATYGLETDLGLMITTDEELGGDEGVGRLVAEGWRTRLLINGDGGHGDAVSYAEKGIVQLDVTARVTPGQRYAPWNGESAANVLIRHLNDGLGQLCPNQDRLSAESNWGTTSCILGLFSSSDSPMPPAEASASVRLYWTGEERGAEILALAREALHPLSVEGAVVAERVYLSPDDQRLLSLKEALERHFGKPYGMKADNGASDAKWFAPLDTAIVLLRFPGEGAHMQEEWLEIDAFAPFYKALRDYIDLQNFSLKTGSSNGEGAVETSNLLKGAAK